MQEPRLNALPIRHVALSYIVALMVGRETKGKELVADLVVAVSGWLAILDSSSYYRAEVAVVALSS